jgi:hypothetical protein
LTLQQQCVYKDRQRVSEIVKHRALTFFAPEILQAAIVLEDGSPNLYMEDEYGERWKLNLLLDSRAVESSPIDKFRKAVESKKAWTDTCYHFRCTDEIDPANRTAAAK